MVKATVERMVMAGTCQIALVLTGHGNGSLFVVVVDEDVGTFGSIVHARREVSLHGRETIDVATKLGDRGNRMPELWARMVLETCRKEARDIVFCFGVKKNFGKEGDGVADAKKLCRALSETVDELVTKQLVAGA